MILELEQVSFKRDQLTILDQINWTVKAGEHWCLLGLNGSGKTTLLNIINGYQWPTSGKVSVLGHPFGSYDLRELRKEIGWVSSSLQTRIYESSITLDIVLSGKYNTIGIYDEIHDEDIDRAKSLLNTFKLDHVAQQPYRTLSQGERQKVLIARALMSEPKLLVLDEPCTGLDFISREDLLDAIAEMANSLPVTIIFVTHHIEEIRPFLTHTLLLKAGTVFAQNQTSLLLKDHILSEFFNRNINIAKENGQYWLTMNKQ